MGGNGVLSSRTGFSGCRALESSAGVWQRCCAAKMGRRMPAVACRKETGTWYVWKKERSFCFSSALQVSLWSVQSSQLLISLLDPFPSICDCVMWWLCKWSYSLMFCAEKCCENGRAGDWGTKVCACNMKLDMSRGEVALGFCTSILWGTKCHHLQFIFFAVIKALSMPVMQNRKHKENVFSSAIILACLCVYESFLLHLEGWDAELFSKEVSKVHPHSSQQLAWQKGYSKWLALFPSILPLET